MICISLVAFLAFNFLRPRNDVVYAPKQLHDADRKAHVRPPSDGFFAWLPVLWGLKEDEIVSTFSLYVVYSLID